MQETYVSKTLKVTLYILLAGGALTVVTLPFMLDRYLLMFYDAYSVHEGYRTFILIFLMFVGTLGLWIVAELIGMLRTISKDPFVRRNVQALRRMGVVAVVTAALFLGKCLIYITILTLTGGILLLICGMFAFTLAGLFRQAVAFKEENDLTI